MKHKKLLVILAVCVPPLVTYLPFTSVIEFEARGHFGDETIRVYKNGRFTTLLDATQIGKAWKVFTLETIGPVSNIRIYYLNAPKPTDPPRLLYIHHGIVKFYKKNLLGNVISRQDILNIDSTYNGMDDKPLFPVKSLPMATVRSGITGWTGYYELYPN